MPKSELVAIRKNCLGYCTEEGKPKYKYILLSIMANGDFRVYNTVKQEIEYRRWDCDKHNLKYPDESSEGTYYHIVAYNRGTGKYTVYNTESDKPLYMTEAELVEVGTQITNAKVLDGKLTLLTDVQNVPEMMVEPRKPAKYFKGSAYAYPNTANRVGQTLLTKLQNEGTSFSEALNEAMASCKAFSTKVKLLQLSEEEASERYCKYIEKAKDKRMYMLAAYLLSEDTIPFGIGYKSVSLLKKIGKTEDVNDSWVGLYAYRGTVIWLCV